MDIISLGKAKKAKKAIQEVRQRIGVDGSQQLDSADSVGGIDKTVRERLEALEAKREGLRDQTLVYDTDADWNSGAHMDTTSKVGSLKLINASVVKTSSGTYHTLILFENGNLYSFGKNNYGQLGNGTTTNSSTPVFVLGNVADIYTGSDHSFAIMKDNSLKAWGLNDYGQLGDGTTTNRTSPVTVSTPNGWSAKKLSGGFQHTMLITSNNKVYTVGKNYNGQLGNGTTTDSLSWVYVMDGVEATATYSSSYAINNSGGVTGWGYNAWYLGDGTSTTRLSPVAIGSFTTAKKLFAGKDFAFCIDSSNRLHGWGNNSSGQVGDGTTTTITSPKLIKSGMLSADGAQNNSVGVDTNFNVFTWGENGSKQLGDGTTTDRLNPNQLTTFSDAKVVSFQNFTGYVVKNDGSIWDFGSSGNTGTNITTDFPESKSSGYWTSSSISLGEDLISLDSIGLTGVGLGNASIFTKTENDNDYVALNTDGTIASNFGKALQVKAELIHGTTPPEVDDLTVNYKAKPLVNRVGEMEERTAINLNKHNLHMNTVVNKSRYGLSELVFDDFQDDAGIDSTLSSGYVWDSTQHIMTTDPNATSTELVTVSETADAIPQMINVSLGYSPNLAKSKEMDEVNGAYTKSELVNGDLQIQIYDAGKGYYYANATYESPVIDVGDTFDTLTTVQAIDSIPTGASVTYYTATSTDNITFSSFEAVGANQEILSPNGRYVKVKVEIGAVVSSVSELTVVSSYDAAKVVNSNGDYKLLDQSSTTEYVKNMQNNMIYAEREITQKKDQWYRLAYDQSDLLLKNIEESMSVDSAKVRRNRKSEWALIHSY